MKVLLCHNYYQQPGGEDQSFAAEARLLEAHGHEVLRFTRHNDAIATMSRWDVAGRTVWSRETYSELRRLLHAERPALMHCTNTFPLISPAAYYAARAEGVPVVQSLRNYRLLCPNALFLRDGRVCEDCLARSVPWPGVVHRCYRGQRTASAVVAGMLTVHRALRTWARAVDVYFTPTEFARRKYIAGGFPADRIVVKPNFIDPDPGPGNGTGGFAVFAGRLSPEKGIATLLAAWPRLGGRLPLKIVGDGPLAPQVQEAAQEQPSVQWLGRLAPQQLLNLIGDAAVLIVPSVWYETFGRTVIEAYAKGTPVIASRIGALAELVDEGRAGLLAEPGDAEDLAAKVQQLVDDPPRLAQMRQAARREYETKYTAERNYRMLTAIYAQARAADRRAKGA